MTYTDDEISLNGNRFKLIPNFLAGYYISDSGAVFSTHRDRLRKQEIDDEGYHRISFPHPGLTKIAIHRLVYKTWVGEIPDGYVIDHLDNRKWNNNYTNLQAITASENSRKAAQDGLYNSSFQWNEDNVYKVCKMMEENVSVRDIAESFGIYPRDVIKYKNFRNQLYNFRKYQRSWKDITEKFDFNGYDGFIRSDSKFRDKDIKIMRDMYNKGVSAQEIASRFNTCNNEYFRRILNGKKRKVLKI